MSEASERPAGAGDAKEPDPDAWAAACEEDLAAERERRARRGAPPPSAAEELRRLADAVADKVAQLGLPLAAAAAQGVARQLIDQAKAAARPVVERNPEVFDHLAAAGQELLAAYHAAVREQEHRWTRSGPASGRDSAVDAPAPPADADPAPSDPAASAAADGHPEDGRPDEERRRPEDGGETPGTQRIDLD